jgi:hypothetical protein
MTAHRAIHERAKSISFAEVSNCIAISMEVDVRGGQKRQPANAKICVRKGRKIG